MRKLAWALVVPVLALGIYGSREVRVNSWRCSFSNYGMWAHDDSGRTCGLWQDSRYLLGAGVWIGAVLGNDTVVSMGLHPWHYTSEMFPSLVQDWRQGAGDSRDRVYVYPGDWPPPSDRFPNAPSQPLAGCEVWSCCCDSDPSRHRSGGQPMGLDIETTVFADTGSLFSDVLILRYDISNRRGEPITGFIFGLLMDADVGIPPNNCCGYIRDRWVRTAEESVRVQSTGFTWSLDGPPTGAAAVVFLDGPLGREATAFKRWCLYYWPVSDDEQYECLAGYNWMGGGGYEPFDSLDDGPQDKQMAISQGPMSLNPGQRATYWLGVIGTPFTPADTSGLALRYRAVESMHARLAGIAEAPAIDPTEVFRVTPSVVRVGKAVVVSGLRDSEPVFVYDAVGRLRRTSTGRLATDGLGRGVYLVRTRARTAKLIIE
jgi:hypothetical protein